MKSLILVSPFKATTSSCSKQSIKTLYYKIIMTKTKNLVAIAKLFPISMFMVVHNSFTKPSQDIKTTKNKKKKSPCNTTKLS
jgi:hypothetical protein